MSSLSYVFGSFWVLPMEQNFNNENIFNWPLFRLFKLTLQFLQQIHVKNVHPVPGAGIQTHNLHNMSFLWLSGLFCQWGSNPGWLRNKKQGWTGIDWPEFRIGCKDIRSIQMWWFWIGRKKCHSVQSTIQVNPVSQSDEIGINWLWGKFSSSFSRTEPSSTDLKASNRCPQRRGQYPWAKMPKLGPSL